MPYYPPASAGSGSIATDTIWDAKGDLAGGTGADTAAKLAVGSDGQVLTADAAQTTGMKWAAGGGGGSGALIFLEAHTASASATLDFTTFISATYDTYLFELVSLIPATNHVNLIMRMGTGGGPTYDSGANYSYDNFVWRSGGTAAGGGTGQTAIAINYTTGTTLETGTAADAASSGSLTLSDPQSTALWKRVEGRLTYRDSGGFRVGNMFRGSYESATAVTAIQFLMSSGNITSGVIRVYGVAKS